jgi:hypothetical protein
VTSTTGERAAGARGAGCVAAGCEEAEATQAEGGSVRVVGGRQSVGRLYEVIKDEFQSVTFATILAQDTFLGRSWQCDFCVIDNAWKC